MFAAFRQLSCWLFFVYLIIDYFFHIIKLWNFQILGHCFNEGICLPSALNGVTHQLQCICPPGFGGSRCEIDWCHRNEHYCLHNGTILSSIIFLESAFKLYDSLHLQFLHLFYRILNQFVRVLTLAFYFFLSFPLNFQKWKTITGHCIHDRLKGIICICSSKFQGDRCKEERRCEDYCLNESECFSKSAYEWGCRSNILSFSFSHCIFNFSTDISTNLFVYFQGAKLDIVAIVVMYLISARISVIMVALVNLIIV